MIEALVALILIIITIIVVALLIIEMICVFYAIIGWLIGLIALLLGFGTFLLWIWVGSLVVITIVEVIKEIIRAIETTVS